MTYHDDAPAPEPTAADLLQEIRRLHKSLCALAAHTGLDPVMLQVEPADARELDSEYGNPVIDRVPKNWTGEALDGRHFSDLQPATLRALAKHFASLADWHDEKRNVDNKGRPRSFWARKDASRALGWALRLEAQGHRGPKRSWHPQHREERHPAEAPPDLDESSDDIPF